MIGLLEKTAVARRRDGDRVLEIRSSLLLEWDSVKAQVCAHCTSSQAADAVRARLPFASLEPIQLHRDLADELETMSGGGEGPPVIDLGAALELIRQNPPIRLEGPDLVHLAGIGRELGRLRDHLMRFRDHCPHWGEAGVQMATFDGVCGAIERALDLDGRIVDSASPLLARLRNAVAGQERAVRQAVSEAMGKARGQGWTTAGEATLRGDRFCIPMRSGDSTRVPGIVHDRSSTGATLFVEPAAVVNLANRLAETRLEIAAEEARILFELNQALERAIPALDEAAQVMLLVDETRAGRRWSRLVGGQRPQIEEGGRVRICAGRHPLLIEALGRKAVAGPGPSRANREVMSRGRDLVVPLELEIAPDARALVISGPNAGGKSVALKSVGVFCLLAQCGWDVPAREDTVLPLVRRLLVDLGDDQSIAEALSSFSAHLDHLGRFMREAGPGTLVLCDEVGSGTDPHEGTALAFAVLEKLVEKGARVLASTHFGLLKAAVHDHPRMVNAAMDYDEDDLRPLFTFRVGDPGTSHAFDIAARMGFEPALLDRARQMAGVERVQVEKLLTDLDRRAHALASAEHEAQLQKGRLEQQNQELTSRLKKIEKEKRLVLEQARQEAENLLGEGRRIIEKAVRDIKAGGAHSKVVRFAHERLAGLRGKVAEIVPDSESSRIPKVVEPGQRVRIPHLNLVGKVLEVRGEKIIADADGLRLTLGFAAVRPVDRSEQDDVSGNTRSVASGNWSWQGSDEVVPPEIDLRGEMGAEAWDRLDRLIDRAIPAGLESLTVIHGFGTGRLRDHLHDRLRRDPRVTSFKEGGPGQGGGGATRVFLS